MGSYDPPFDAVADTPDQRDWVYRPALQSLDAKIDPRTLDWWSEKRVRDQEREPSCTGYALAALIDHLQAKRSKEQQSDAEMPEAVMTDAPWASAYMLYRNAQFHDEWEGEAYSGSSLRGVIKGLYHNGVCSLETENDFRCQFKGHPSQKAEPWFTNHELVSKSRQVQLGAYFRVQSRLTDMHAALSESGMLLASAKLHSGWQQDLDDKDVIPFGPDQEQELSDGIPQPRHAFIVLGYDDECFWIQNSWGTGWGRQGLARWRYADWARNVLDAWVLQLAVPVPDAFRLSLGMRGVSRAPVDVGLELAREARDAKSGPVRLDVLGHMIPIENGRIKRHGRYHHNLETLQSTFHIVANRLTTEAQQRLGAPFAANLQKTPADDFWYRHVHIQFVGGWRREVTTASHVRKLQQVYKANRIYPVFFYWEPGTYSEIYRLLRTVVDEVNAQTNTGDASRQDLRQQLIELKVALMGRRLKAELLQASSRFFYAYEPDDKDLNIQRRQAGEGIKLFDSLLEELSWRFRNRSISYHMTAHGFGVWIIVQFLASQDLLKRRTVISSLNLISPAFTIDEFKGYIAPSLVARTDGSVNRAARLRDLLIENANLWHNSPEDERVDTFDDTYRRSWPEFWSRVIGFMDRNEAWEEKSREAWQDPPHLQVVHDKAGTKFYRAKQLNLAEFALEANELAQQKGWPLNVKSVRREDDDARGKHFGMDLTPMMVNELMAEMLGGEENIRLKCTSEPPH